ncbi:hypothetical protein ACX0G9_30050 [Flavitalea flava]
MERAKYKKNLEASIKILAYALFVDEGLAAVERMYPQYKNFVLGHKGKSLTEVKNELLHSQVAS